MSIMFAFSDFDLCLWGTVFGLGLFCWAIGNIAKQVAKNDTARAVGKGIFFSTLSKWLK